MKAKFSDLAVASKPVPGRLNPDLVRGAHVQWAPPDRDLNSAAATQAGAVGWLVAAAAAANRAKPWTLQLANWKLISDTEQPNSRCKPPGPALVFSSLGSVNQGETNQRGHGFAIRVISGVLVLNDDGAVL